jgi:hypothetical protein
MPHPAIFIGKRIIEIERKYALYFWNKEYRIKHCIKVNWEEPISIHLINHLLPFEIAYEIETIFWSE